MCYCYYNSTYIQVQAINQSQIETTKWILSPISLLLQTPLRIDSNFSSAFFKSAVNKKKTNIVLPLKRFME